jgi:hypothetical protein
MAVTRPGDGVRASRERRRAGTPSYLEEVLADAPVAFWRMDESSGTTMNDSSGNSRNGNYANTPTLGATKLCAGTAVEFVRTSSEYAGVTSTNALNAGVASLAWTVEMWVKITDTSFATNEQVLIDKTGAGSAAGQYAVWYDNTVAGGSAHRIRWFCGSTAQLDWNDCATEMAAGGHLVCTIIPGVTDGQKIYWNGVLKAQQTGSKTWSTGNTNALELARSNGAALYAGATLDEVALYPAALSAARILAHYAARG